MESRTFAVFDSVIWFIKVGLVLSLLASTIAHKASSGNSTQRVGDAPITIEVKLVKTLPSRNSGRRTLGVGRDRNGAISNDIKV